MWFAVFYCCYYAILDTKNAGYSMSNFSLNKRHNVFYMLTEMKQIVPGRYFFSSRKQGKAIIPRRGKITCLNEIHSFKSKAGSSIKARLSSLIHISSFFDSLFQFLLRFIVSFSCYSAAVVCTQLNICNGSKDTQMKCRKRLMPLFSLL